MPSLTLQSGEKVLVTGASGYIATWIVKYLLDAGFNVRGTVRSEEKGNYLKDLFMDYVDHFEYVVVEEMTVNRAFDEAVKDMNAIIHTASPFDYRSEDPDLLIKPAIKGTTNILESALESSSLKRVIILASAGSVIEPVPEGQRVFSERDWIYVSVREVKEKGKNAHPIDKYCTSKFLAEKAALDFVQTNADKIAWDLVAINPAFTWGPPLHLIPNAQSINASLIPFNAVITGRMEATAAHIASWIDVRDVVNAHVGALTTPEAGGERFIIASGPYCWQDVLDAVHADSEDDMMLTYVPRGNPGAGKNTLHAALIDTSKAASILGLTNYYNMKTTVKDTARILLAIQMQR